MDIIQLKPGREKPLKQHHPWVFSGAVAKVVGEPEPGTTVQIQDSNGRFLAYGAYSPSSQIRIRAWTWDPKESIGVDFFRKQLRNALDYRSRLPYVQDSHQTIVEPTEAEGDKKVDQNQNNPPNTSHARVQIPDEYSLRLVHAESDGIPGLVVDRYQDTLVVQFLSVGVEHWWETLLDLLQELTGIKHIYERSDVDVRQLEGLAVRLGPVRGDPPTKIIIAEHNMKFAVDIASGHKTGFYLDQRENRLKLRRYVQEMEVLDCFCYSGGFTVNALRGGAASVTAVDSADSALDLARENVRLNDFPQDRVQWICGDVFQQLRRFRDQGRSFDTIVLDPPKFAPTSAHVSKASRGYKDINLLALKLLRPGGTLMTFSCSGGISAGLFQKIVAGAAQDAGLRPRLVEHLEQSPDHPVALNFPEGAYLKGLLLQV